MYLLMNNVIFLLSIRATPISIILPVLAVFCNSFACDLVFRLLHTNNANGCFLFLLNPDIKFEGFLEKVFENNV